MTYLVDNISQTELLPILSAEIKHYNRFYLENTDDVDIYILHVITRLHFMY